MEVDRQLQDDFFFPSSGDMHQPQVCLLTCIVSFQRSASPSYIQEQKELKER